jgi:hypothetical protein
VVAHSDLLEKLHNVKQSAQKKVQALQAENDSLKTELGASKLHTLAKKLLIGAKSRKNYNDVSHMPPVET